MAVVDQIANFGKDAFSGITAASQSNQRQRNVDSRNALLQHQYDIENDGRNALLKQREAQARGEYLTKAWKAELPPDVAAQGAIQAGYIKDEHDLEGFYQAYGKGPQPKQGTQPRSVEDQIRIEEGKAAAKAKYAKPAAPKAEPAPSLTEIVDPKDPTRMLRVDTRAYKPGGSLGDPGVFGVSGKEPTNAAKETQSTGGQNSVTDQVANLRDLYGQLDTAGAITNPDKGALTNNLPAAIGSSAPGQMLGRAFGTQNQSIRNAITQARPLLLQAIRQATGMTAKQMDSNTELKLYLQAATDPSLDIKANLEALDNIERLYGVKVPVDAPATPAEAPAAAPAAPASVLKYDANGRRIP